MTLNFLEGNMEINMQYLKRKDSDPFFTGYNGDDFITDGGLIEILFFPQGEDGRIVFAGLYNRVKSDDLMAESEDASLTLNYLLARNAKLLIEYQRDIHREKNNFFLGFTTAY